MEGLGVAGGRCTTLSFQFIEELPSVRPIEFPNSDGRYERGLEVPQVHSVLGSLSWNQRLPVRYAAARATVDGSHRSASLDVLGGGFRMALDSYCAELVVDPRTTDAATKRAVAVRGHDRGGWQRQPNSTAVTRAFMHLGTFAARSWMGDEGRWCVPGGSPDERVHYGIPALPRTVRIAEEHIHVQSPGQRLVLGHLGTLIVGKRLSQALRHTAQSLGEPLEHRRRAEAIELDQHEVAAGALDQGANG